MEESEHDYEPKRIIIIKGNDSAKALATIAHSRVFDILDIALKSKWGDRWSSNFERSVRSAHMIRAYAGTRNDNHSDWCDLQILTHTFDRSLSTSDLFDRLDLDKSGGIR